MATSTTTDVDTFTPTTAALDDAAALANKETGLAIPLAHAAIADVPWNYQDRLIRALPELQKLELYVLEKHDLALSKAVRCSDHDLQQLREIQLSVGPEFDVLVTRFCDEMGHAVGDGRALRANFLITIDTLFGELKRVAAKKRLDPP